MFTLKALLRGPEIKLAEYRTALGTVAEEAITEAAFAWVETAISFIPVWSGASRATFAALAEDISFQIQIGTAANAPDREAQGRQESSGGVNFDRARGHFSFSYSTTLDHLIFNENFNANVKEDPKVFARLLQPGPYNFQEQANARALEVIQDVVFPDIREFITTIDTRV